MIIPAVSYNFNHDYTRSVSYFDRHFQNYAIETINRTYNKQPGEAIKLLGQKMENWGNTTCLMLALTGGNKTFLSQLACREFNSRIWYFGSLVGTKEVNLNHASEVSRVGCLNSVYTVGTRRPKLAITRKPKIENVNKAVYLVRRPNICGQQLERGCGS